MLELRPIKNISNPPYFFGIRGKYFMECMLSCSGALLGGVMGCLTFVRLDSFWIGMFILGLSAVLASLIYIYYRYKSKNTPFRGLKKEADMISHINFNDIVK